MSRALVRMKRNEITRLASRMRPAREASVPRKLSPENFRTTSAVMTGRA
jgi:hypothetical protein